MSIITLKNVTYYYDEQEILLNDISLELESGRMYAITGASGSGKTTLLSLMGGLAEPISGQILYEKDDRENIKDSICYLPAEPDLIEFLTAEENVMLAQGKSSGEMLELVELTPEETARNVLKLSDGQRQRVAVARMLASDTSIILADEPTAHLHFDLSLKVASLLRKEAHERNRCVVIITSSKDVAAYADLAYHLEEGRMRQITYHDCSREGLKKRREEDRKKDREILSEYEQ